LRSVRADCGAETAQSAEQKRRLFYYPELLEPAHPRRLSNESRRQEGQTLSRSEHPWRFKRCRRLAAGRCKIAARLDYFVGENAKSTRAFLNKINALHVLLKPLQELEIRELNVSTPPQNVPELLAPLLAGRDGGLVSEAGCPAVADPGADLVRLAHEKGITVCPLVGPSSILLALMGSGMNGQSFAFHGYLPIGAPERVHRIHEIEQRSRHERQTQIFIETPYRNQPLSTPWSPPVRLILFCA